MAKEKMQKLKDIALDTSLPKARRVKAALEIKERLLNPIDPATFDPDTYEPEAENEFVKLIPRARKKPPRRLPTGGLKPKEIMEGQQVGRFESKQELYLLIAALSERVADLEDLLNVNQ
jgi:hypothetical protein